MKISVILPVYLGYYETHEFDHLADQGITGKCAVDRVNKFHRAVDSFIASDYPDRELIIVSDDCDEAERVYREDYATDPSIVYTRAPKRVSVMCGRARTFGLMLARGDIICYLDSDDFLGVSHLSSIVSQFTYDIDWAYYDDRIVLEYKDYDTYRYSDRRVSIKQGLLGTSSICHRPIPGMVWGDGYRSDWRMIDRYLLGRPVSKLSDCCYCVCHFPALGIDV